MLLPMVAFLQAAAPPVSPAGYWQQHISYAITASLDESAGMLRGTQRIRYRNESPDTLTTLSFHLYLNAFRPGSRWSDADSVEGRRRFNDLRDPDFGMNHVANVRIMGQPVAPVYPFSPDSTVVRFVLPRPLPPGGTLDAEMDWDARPSTVPRRQGRQGRAFDFAQWYPRVVAYDKHGWQEHPLYPAGEFYGDFGDFSVTLDLPEDQVIGATGVPLCGDPGWERASRQPGRPIEYGRDRYPAALAALGADACAPRGPGRKTIVWRAEAVHHFAMSLRPDYRYEGGRFGDVAVHVLYQPGDEATWGNGVAVRRTEVALEWLDGLFGRYPWPQMTNVHRIEGGGTEFPMMMHNGSASQELILHEGGHNYLMGILANNEWREGFLDEGFTSFQTTWFAEERASAARDPDFERYANLEAQILWFDREGWSEPTSYVSERYRDFATYNTMIYARGELFFHQLREIVGAETMRRILRTYYDRWQLKHVDEGAFRAVAEEVSGRDLGTFFGQWLHGVTSYDYAVGRVRRQRDGDRGWVTRVEVVRRAPGVFPVEVVVRGKTDSAMVRVDGAAERQWVELRTVGRPDEVEIDSRVRSHDWNMLDNRKRKTFLGWAGGGRTDWHLDRVFSTRAHRDRMAEALLPTVWYNDAGGVMVGLRTRSNYQGRHQLLTAEVSLATRLCCEQDASAGHWFVRLRNPTWLARPRLGTSLEAFRVEGRHGVAVGFEQRTRGHLTYGPTTSYGGSVRWVATYDTQFLDPALYEDAGTVEANWFVRSSGRRGPWGLNGTVSVGGGIEYRNRGTGIDTDDRFDVQGYSRVTVEATARRALGSRGTLGARVFGGWVEGGSGDPVRQRWFYLAGADPYQQLTNPFVRSRDALLTGDVHFQVPGGGNVRGLERDVAVTALAALTVEADRSVFRRARPGLFQDVRVAAFGDLAVTDGFFSFAGSGTVAGDAGVGIRFSHTLGQTNFVTRFDVPLFVSHPDRSVGGAVGDGKLGLRWIVAVSPSF
ncbi:MAG: M1 family metallopeptidase [Gemmatimonadales bacterium]|nr:M1 family metallopeptidase [Gemmatimonadales bacterium]